MAFYLKLSMLKYLILNSEMKKIIILAVILTSAFAQISVNDLNKLSNEQLDAIKQEIQGSSNSVVPQLSQVSTNNATDELNSAVAVSLPSKLPNLAIKEKFFGYNFFNRSINFFDNIPTPANFKLGPGDEIILSLWGEANSRENFIISKEGLIYYDKIGFINISNKTIKEAEELLKNELSKVYSTIKSASNPTKLKLELGKLKSINVFFTGEVKNPGIHIIHPFSDIFSAIVQAGGLETNGSLRKIQLIRNQVSIAEFDFYEFFLNGYDSFTSISLVEGDVIHIPFVQNRVKIEGEVVNSTVNFEVLDNERLSQIIGYAGGLTARASTNISIERIANMKNRTSEDNAITSITINMKDAESFKLNNGDVAVIKPIGFVDTKVNIYGRVKLAGSYPAKGASLKDILDLAGGFDDPIFRKSIVDDEIIVLRQDSNKFYGTEYKVSYEDSSNFMMEVNDQIFVYEDVNYRNNYTFSINGEVQKPGTYQYHENLTLKDAIDMAGGFTALSDLSQVVMIKNFTSINPFGGQSVDKQTIGNLSLETKIGTDTKIIVKKIENTFKIQGNVYNPGLIGLSNRESISFRNAIQLAGGYKKYTKKNGIYIKKSNGTIMKRTRFSKISSGDTIVVPVDDNPQDFNLTLFLSEISQTLANLIAIMVLVDQVDSSG
jgi:protein involved in polysaccharide export with SLBB domain